MEDAHENQTRGAFGRIEGPAKIVCPSKKLDRAAVQAQIRQTSGPEYWRSLEELAGTPEFRRCCTANFRKAPRSGSTRSRAAASCKVDGRFAGLAGMTGCVPSLPLEPIVPYVRQPEDVIPGRPMYYATASRWRIRQPAAGRKPSRPSHED